MSIEKRTLKGANLSNVDDKSHPNPEGRAALVAISVGAQYHEGDHFKAILMGIKKAGYKKVKILVGGYLQRYNYLRLLAIKQATKEGLSPDLLYQGKKIHELSAEEFDKFDKLMQPTANEDGLKKEKEWIERNRAAINEVFPDREIEVEVIEWQTSVERNHSYAGNRRKVDAEFGKVNGYQKFVNNAVDELRVIHLRECEADSYGDALDTHREKFKQKDRDYILEESAVLVDEQFKDCDFIYPMGQSRVSQLVVKGVKTVIANQGIDIGLKFYSANFVPHKQQKQHKRGSSGGKKGDGSDSDSDEASKPKTGSNSPKNNGLPGSSDAIKMGSVGMFAVDSSRGHSMSDPLPLSSGVAVVPQRPYSDSTTPSQVVVSGSPPRVDGVNPIEEMALRDQLARVTLNSGVSGPVQLKFLSTLFEAPSAQPLFYTPPQVSEEGSLNNARHNSLSMGKTAGGGNAW